MRTALIIVDVQNGFCDDFEPAELPVSGGADCARRINAHLRDTYWRYDVVAATRDWHIDPGAHFAAQPDFTDSWPAHCVAGTAGAELHPALLDGLDAAGAVQLIVNKGHFAAAYSGFEGTVARDRDGLLVGVGLAEALRHLGIDRVDVVGIATDHCVRATGLDASEHGFTVRVIAELTAGVTPDTSAAALDQLAAAGAEIVTAADAAADLPKSGCYAVLA